MSTNRSSSGVRSLKAMFENPESAQSETRGRSTNGELSPANGERPLSKVRSSFVPVDKRSVGIETNQDNSKSTGERRSSTASLRRESVSLNEHDNKLDLEELKQTLSQEKEARKQSTTIPETVPENAIQSTSAPGTPAVEASDTMAATATTNGEEEKQSMEDTTSRFEAMTLPTKDTPADNPDKPVSSVDDEPVKMTSGDPKEMTASPARKVTAGSRNAPKSPASAMKTPSKAKTTPATPGSTSSRKATPSKVQTTFAKLSELASPKQTKPKSPSSTFKSQSSGSRPTTSDSKASAAPSHRSSGFGTSQTKPGRSSLTAPTAASAAKNKGSATESGPAKEIPSKAAVSKSRPRSPTRPAKLSSHLTAPTASSSAKHDAPKAENAKPAAKPSSSLKPAAPKNPLRASTTTKPTTKPAATAAKSSLSQSVGPKSQPQPRTSNVKPADEGFLARMMRPTASSSSKTHEKSDIKEPPKHTPNVHKPRPQAASRLKAAKGDKPGAGTSAPTTNGNTEKVMRGSVVTNPQAAKQATPQSSKENETPNEVATPDQSINATTVEDSADAPNGDNTIVDETDVSATTPSQNEGGETTDPSPASTPAFDTDTIR